MQRCASCGIAEIDDIKLKNCDDCDLVKYCNDECQNEHRQIHEEECKKRAAELYDEILFKQPESGYLGDCPLCCLPLPFDTKSTVAMSCCSKEICSGCNYANMKREILARLQHKCPFCREPASRTKEEINEQWMKRIEANDPFALRQIGMKKYIGGDYNTAFEYLKRAAALGDVQAHFQLSIYYEDGEIVEKDEKKFLYHLKEAAIGGHPDARYNLALVEGLNGEQDIDRAAKHFIIAAKLGYDKSLEILKVLYKAGDVSKDDFAAALRGYHAAIEAMKSPLREEAAEIKKRLAERRLSRGR